MDSIRNALRDALAVEGEARTFLADAREKVLADPGKLAVLFPQLPRRIGRAPTVDRPHLIGTVSDGAVDLAAWRRCDIAALLLLTEGDPAAWRADGTLLDLYLHGDLEEKTMALRALAALPGAAEHDAAAALVGEAQRTNNVAHFETLALDSDVILRARDAGTIADDEVRRLVLKIAFLDLELGRLFGWERLADPELTRMIQDLATEREAATRKVWHDTNRLIAHAPIEGTRARLLGGLEHGDDPHRLAAAEGLGVLPDAYAMAPFAAERLGREPRAEIRGLLEPLARTAR